MSVLVVFGLSGFAGAQEVTIQLSNGTAFDAFVERIDSQSLLFRAAGSQTSARVAFDQIDTVGWPEPDIWMRACQFYDLERYPEAIALFRKIGEDENPSRYYFPAPGNFVSRSKRRILDCYRRTGDATAISKEWEAFDPSRLPASERELPYALVVWAAAGEDDWGRVKTLANEASATLDPASSDGIEIAYLSGLAYEKEGETRQALIAYGQAYALNAATDPRLSRIALERSINLLARDWERQEDARDERREEAADYPELRAQVHLYASLFGRGLLWEDAAPLAVTALNEAQNRGEAALGQSGRTRVAGDMARESEGTEMVEQVTADHMKKVEVKSEEESETAQKGEKSGNSAP